MKKQGLFRRILFPILLILAVMVFSSRAYDYSQTIRDPFRHAIVVHASAVLMFISIWMGAFFANTIAFYRGATFQERLIVCLFTPVVWGIKTWASGMGIFSPGEMVFLAFHHMVLGCPAVALLCMGISEIGLRARQKKTGDGTVRVMALNNSAVLSVGAGLTFVMLFNGGHAYYYRYMDLYTAIFH
jgi:hypothetical protein